MAEGVSDEVAKELYAIRRSSVPPEMQALRPSEKMSKVESV
jgi:hypothetical protein